MRNPQHNPTRKPDRCPACEVRVRLEPAHLEGVAPCPCCGSLLKFVVRDSQVYFHVISRSQEPTLWSQLAFESLKPGFQVRITHGAFEGFEGEVEQLDPETRHVKVTIDIFGQLTTVELESWQVERMSDP